LGVAHDRIESALQQLLGHKRVQRITFISVIFFGFGERSPNQKVGEAVV
jgi:hypothetical protein